MRHKGEAAVDLDPEKAQLLSRWGLSAERAVRYVMQAAAIEELRKVVAAGWRPQAWAPRADGTHKTAAEQLNETILKFREDLMHTARLVEAKLMWSPRLRGGERYPEIESTVKESHVASMRREKGRWSCVMPSQAVRNSGMHPQDCFAAKSEELEDRHAEVLHNVDGTRLAVDPRFQGMENSFGAVYYNFPHAGVVQGFFDGHPFVRWRHENLMHLFFRALRGFVKPGGVVKVASNSNATGPCMLFVFRYPERRAKQRVPPRRDDAVSRVEPEVLPSENYRCQSKGSDMAWGPAGCTTQQSCSNEVYTFRYEPSGSVPPKALIRRPPTKDDLFLSKEGKMPMSAEQKRQRLEDRLQWSDMVFMPAGCHIGILEALLGRLAVDSHCEARLTALWHPSSLTELLQLAQVASMLQIDEVMPELVGLVSEAMASGADAAELEAACERLQLPPSIQEVAASARPISEPAGLPHTDQVRGMISSALHTADGKVWRVVQKVIDRREAWPRLAKENAAMLLGFAQGAHGSIRATPHTGFFWGSRDFLYLVCRYIRARPEIFDAMVTAMFEEVYSMDPELPAEVIDAVFKDLLVHEGLTFAQCEHVIDKLMQRGEQIEYLFHEWSGVFPALPAAARQALAKGLLPSVGRCPHAALDFVLKELDALPQPEGCARHTNAWWGWYVSFGCMRRRQRWRKR
eukprot:s1502_g11.t2